MGIIRKTFSSTLYLVSAVVLALSLSVYLCPVPIFPQEEVVRLATEYYGSDTSCPMCDKIAIVTGSTNGLGESIALQMYKVGAPPMRLCTASELYVLSTDGSYCSGCL